MKSLLNALQDGRLIELPGTGKDQALEYLALLIEAIPDIGTGTDLVGEVKTREQSANTGLGMGVACPHARSAKEGEMLCAVGWSPAGIDYGAADGKKVHLVIMYYIPDSQRNVYLKEISGLAKAIHASAGIEAIINAPDLNSVRNQLLDWVGLALDAVIPDAKARMIQLEAKQAAVSAALAPAADKLRAFKLIPFSVLMDNDRPILLAQDRELVAALEQNATLKELLKQNTDFDLSGYRVLQRASSAYAANRQLYECLAVKM